MTGLICLISIIITYALGFYSGSVQKRIEMEKDVSQSKDEYCKMRETYLKKNSKPKAMTPKEKAKELFEKFYKMSLLYYPSPASMKKFKYIGMTKSDAKKCAIICVDEIILTHSHKDIIGIGNYHSKIVIDYWQQVKAEIEAL